MPNPAQHKTGAGHAAIRGEAGYRQGRIFFESGEASVIDSASVRSVQQFVTIISSARFITRITNEGLALFRCQTKNRSPRAHRVLPPHYGTEGNCPILSRPLPNAGGL